ncbi:MAG TPA: GNAT family N-acetyltransferase [Phototrophicaceae bacterium]|nr:GNAT family N-acetyltransferase [Phototrophicaceae bacterium]
MDNLQITLESDWNWDAERAVRQGLADYNRQIAGVDGRQPLNLIVRDDAGTVIGGLIGDTYWNWLAINIFWLRDDLRGQGLGSKLLKQAEEEAVRRGCANAHLDTMDFQALGFYQKYGYTVFGVLDGLPAGHVRYYLRKPLP